MNMSDKRLFPRLDSSMEVKYRILLIYGKESQDLGMKNTKSGVTRNISAGGLLFVCPEPLEVSSVIELEVFLPNGAGPFSCLARVLRQDKPEGCGKYHVAGCFLGATAAIESRVDKYVRNNMS